MQNLAFQSVKQRVREEMYQSQNVNLLQSFQMGRDVRTRVLEENQTKEDLLFLLSNIRARQNGLVFFLELFTLTSSNKLGPQQYKIYKEQFLQKQKIYTTQTRALVQKFTTSLPVLSNHCRSFWIKLKSIIRVSLQRSKTLGLLSDSLATRFQQILKLIDQFYQSSSSIKQYIQIQQLINKRTHQALVATRSNFIKLVTQQFPKNRSQTFLKAGIKQVDSVNYSPSNNKKQAQPGNQLPDNDAAAFLKLKSMTRVRKKGDKQKAKLSSSEFKRAQSNIARYDRNLADIMDGRFQFTLDKKKSKNQNQTNFYQALFYKNIANHKMITKYVHTSFKLSNFIKNIQKNQSRQRPVFSQKRLNKGVRQQISQTIPVGRTYESKSKLIRPKTSKNRKTTGDSKIINSRKQRMQLVKMI